MCVYGNGCAACTSTFFTHNDGFPPYVAADGAGGGDAGGGVRVGGEGDEGNPWWMCEKERDQLIGKIDCEGERERKKGSVCVCVC